MKRLLPLVACLPSTAFAHGGEFGAHALITGLAHPLGGLDHLLAMVAVGLWAAVLRGRAILALPASFVVAMILGGLLGAFSLPLPGVEPMILVSILILGILTGFAFRTSLRYTIGVVIIFGIFHGHAHGVEGPANGLAAYAAGFGLATLALHILGVLAGQAVSARVLRGLGGATALAGLALMFGG